MTVNERTPDEPTSRRWLVAAGIAGVAAGLAGARTAGATTPPSTDAPEVTEPPPTAASVPLQPTPADAELLQLVQSAELAVRDLYRTAIAAGAEDPVLVAFARNHQAYADVLSGLLGGPQPRLDELYDQYQASFDTSDVAAVASAAWELESSLVATYADAIGQLEGVNGATRMASILVVESRMATVLANLAGAGDDFDALFTNSSQALGSGDG